MSEEMKTILSTPGGVLSFMEYSISRGKPVTVDFVNVNHKFERSGQTPLHMASKKGYVNAVEYLILKGANIHAKDKNGKIPLHSASENGHVKVVELLILKGADIHAKNERGCTPLHLASRGEIWLPKSRILKGRVKGRNFSFSLVRASSDDHLEVIECLISKGRSIGLDLINEKNKRGETPLHLASENGHAKVLELLISYGADYSELMERYEREDKKDEREELEQIVIDVGIGKVKMI